jgi:hypothetical protein
VHLRYQSDTVDGGDRQTCSSAHSANSNAAPK